MVRAIDVAQQAFDRIVTPVPISTPGAPTNRKGEPKGLVRFEEQVDADITVARLPANEDPDEFVRRDPAGWSAAIAHAQPLIDFLLDVETANLPLDTSHGKLEARRRLLPVIAEVRDRTLADEYIGRLAAKIRMDKVELSRDLQAERHKLDRDRRAQSQRAHDAEASARKDDGFSGTDSENEQYSGVDALGTTYGDAQPDFNEPPTGKTGAPRRLRLGDTPERTLAAYCLGLTLVYPYIWEDISAILDENDFTLSELRALYQALALAAREGSLASGETFISGQASTLGEVAIRTREPILAQSLDEGRVVKVARDAAYRLKRLRLNQEMAELDALQREAEQTQDMTSLRELLDRKRQLLTQRRAIDAATDLYG
jgi:DNA primase